MPTDPQWDDTTAVADNPTWDQTMSGEDVLGEGFKATNQAMGQVQRSLNAGAMATPTPTPPQSVLERIGRAITEGGTQPAGVAPATRTDLPVAQALQAPFQALGRVGQTALQTTRQVLTPTTYLPEEEQAALRPFVIDTRGNEIRQMTAPEAESRRQFAPNVPLLPAGRTALQPQGSDAARMIESLSTPENISQLAAGFGNKVIGFAMLASMVPGAAENVKAVATRDDLTPEEKRDRINNLVLPIALGLRHAWRGRSEAPFEREEMAVPPPLEFTGAAIPGLPRGAAPIRPTAGPEVLGPPVPPLSMRAMPEEAVTAPETGREVNQLQEIRDKGLRTKEQVLGNFPVLRQLPNPRERAADLLRQAWGTEKPAPTPPKTPPEEPPAAPPAEPVPKPPGAPPAVPGAAEPPPEPFAAAPAPETPPSPTPEAPQAVPEPPVEPAKPATIEDTPIAGKTLGEWEQVKDASQLPKGNARAELAKWLAVPNQPARILQALGNKKRTREIHAPPAAEVAPVGPVAPEPVTPSEAKTFPAQMSAKDFPPPASDQEPDLVLIACGKEKLDTSTPVPAASLYTGPLFSARRGFAESQTRPWMILSANHGVIEPGREITPYDTVISDLNPDELKAWKAAVRSKVLDYFGGREGTIGKTVELHGGNDYVKAFQAASEGLGISVVPAIEGKGVGTQLAIYKQGYQRPRTLGSMASRATQGVPRPPQSQTPPATVAPEKPLAATPEPPTPPTPPAALGAPTPSAKPVEAPAAPRALPETAPAERAAAQQQDVALQRQLKGAADKAQSEVSKVTATEGQRLAKEVKQDLIDALQEALMKAPREAKEGDKVTIEIPGDGTFKVVNAVEPISEVLDRAKKIETNPNKPHKISKKQIAASSKIIAKTAGTNAEIAKQRAAEEARTKGKPSVGPGAAAAAEFTARENRRRLLSNITESLFGSRAGEVADALVRKMAGEAVPKTMALSGNAGNKMVRMASANVAAPLMARSMAVEVLGDKFNDENFREHLGAVLVEDRLRAIRAGIERAADEEKDPEEQQKLVDQAADVNTLVGKERYFPNEAAFTAALSDPDIAQAVKLHKETIQPEAERYHTETDGQLAGPGLHTGAFINLLPLFEENPEAIFSSARKGDYTRPFKRRSVFSRRAKGTAARYELDYLPLAERMIRGNYEEYTKRELYNQLQHDQLGVVLAPNIARPTFDGRPAEKFQIKRQTLVTRSGGETRVIPQYENLWVHPDVAPELRQALNLGSPVSNVAIARIANVLNRIQLAGPTDAVWHIANMMSTIAGSQGGETFLTDLARKMPLVNVVDAAVRVTSAAKRVMRNDPDTMRQIADLSQIGAVRPERPGGSITSRVINLLDKAGRSVRDDMYRNLVQRGLVEDSEVGRREFVNQLGQYNPRIMGQLESFFKEAGLSPFIVAGRNFNRMALRRMSLSPGIKAANMKSAIQMRALEGVGVIATLIAVPAILNSITVGKPMGRPGIPFGAIDTGRDDKNGKHVYIDPAQWIGLRRGMRLTGVNALAEGLLRHQPSREIGKQAIHDIIGAAVHPWAGPAVQVPFIGATGYTTSFFKESRDPGDYWQNFLAALRNINPLVHGYFQRQGSGIVGGLQSGATSLAAAAGIKTRAPLSAVNQIHELANSWASRSEDPSVRSNYEQHAKESFSSPYSELRSALSRNDLQGARQAYQELRANGKTPQRIRQTLNHPHPFVGSARLEARFIHSLTPEQRQVYQEALKERRTIAGRFGQLLSTKPQE